MKKRYLCFVMAAIIMFSVSGCMVLAAKQNEKQTSKKDTISYSLLKGKKGAKGEGNAHHIHVVDTHGLSGVQGKDCLHLYIRSQNSPDTYHQIKY